MFRVRRAEERGHFNHGWLDTYHTFSFGRYYDPEHTQFRALRVINEDRVQPGQGFGEHGHEDMEIVTYVLSGALEHRDSLGNGEVLRPGEFQRMSAGTGIRHSEFNPSDREVVHLYQIWLLPREEGLQPSYEQKAFGEEERRGRWRVVASPEGDDGSLTIQQDARIYLSLLEPGQRVQHAFSGERHGWLQVLRGDVRLKNLLLAPGDGVAISQEAAVELTAQAPAEAMLFDLP